MDARIPSSISSSSSIAGSCDGTPSTLALLYIGAASFSLCQFVASECRANELATTEDKIASEPRRRRRRCGNCAAVPGSPAVQQVRAVLTRFHTVPWNRTTSPTPTTVAGDSLNLLPVDRFAVALLPVCREIVTPFSTSVIIRPSISGCARKRSCVESGGGSDRNV